MRRPDRILLRHILQLDLDVLEPMTSNEYANQPSVIGPK